MKNTEIIIALSFLIFLSGHVSAQEEIQSSLDDAEVVESEISLKDVLSARKTEEIAADPDPVVSLEPQMPSASVALRESQVIELNQVLKNVIEQNSALRKEKEDLSGEVKFLRGQRTIDQNRFNAMREEMNNVQKQTEEVVRLSQSYSNEVVDLRNKLRTRETILMDRIRELERKVPAGVESGPSASASVDRVPPAAPAPSAPKRTVEVDVVSMMEQFSQESESLKRDTAKVHYNMGNIFFRKGEYKKASLEYRKVLELVPQDPAAHFNLAFVSGEYLSDPVTALKHYKEYLLLNPDAPDAGEVQGKILEMTLEERMLIDSPIDRIPKVK